MAKPYNVEEFFKTDVPAFGAYDLTRKCCSYIDGMKISMRKIIFTFMEEYPNAKEKIKTETVANFCAAKTNYLHGAQNLCGVCDTLAQSFVGSNNYPFLIGNTGGFGNRINTECAAPRYTKIMLSPLVKKLLNADDCAITDRQFFEGDYIEPKFYVPVFPMVFLNGSSGISIGFGQDIYPRNPSDICEYIKKKLNGTEKPRMDLLPWFKGFLGKVERNKETGIVECFGVFTKNNMTSYTVTELPIGMEPNKYVEVLDALEEKGVIVSYKNKSSTKSSTLCYEIKTTREFTKKHATDRKVYEALRLIKTLPENYVCIDETNKVRKFESVQDILDTFIDFRLKFYDKRKAYILKKLKSSIEQDASRYLFCSGIIKKTIKVSNVKKDDIIAQLDKIDKIIKIDGSYDYLLRMPIHSVTKERMEELKKQIEANKAKFTEIKQMTIQTMWLNDLSELKKVL